MLIRHCKLHVITVCSLVADRVIAMSFMRKSPSNRVCLSLLNGGPMAGVTCSESPCLCATIHSSSNSILIAIAHLVSEGLSFN
jgi:hypothetical protein